MYYLRSLVFQNLLFSYIRFESCFFVIFLTFFHRTPWYNVHFIVSVIYCNVSLVSNLSSVSNFSLVSNLSSVSNVRIVSKDLFCKCRYFL